MASTQFSTKRTPYHLSDGSLDLAALHTIVDASASSTTFLDYDNIWHCFLQADLENPAVLDWAVRAWYIYSRKRIPNYVVESSRFYPMLVTLDQHCQARYAPLDYPNADHALWHATGILKSICSDGSSLHHVHSFFARIQDHQRYALASSLNIHQLRKILDAAIELPLAVRKQPHMQSMIDASFATYYADHMIMDKRGYFMMMAKDCLALDIGFYQARSHIESAVEYLGSSDYVMELFQYYAQDPHPTVQAYVQGLRELMDRHVQAWIQRMHEPTYTDAWADVVASLPHDHAAYALTRTVLGNYLADKFLKHHNKQGHDRIITMALNAGESVFKTFVECVQAQKTPSKTLFSFDRDSVPIASHLEHPLFFRYVHLDACAKNAQTSAIHALSITTLHNICSLLTSGGESQKTSAMSLIQDLIALQSTVSRLTYWLDDYQTKDRHFVLSDVLTSDARDALFSHLSVFLVMYIQLYPFMDRDQLTYYSLNDRIVCILDALYELDPERMRPAQPHYIAYQLASSSDDAIVQVTHIVRSIFGDAVLQPEILGMMAHDFHDLANTFSTMCAKAIHVLDVTDLGMA